MDLIYFRPKNNRVEMHGCKVYICIYIYVNICKYIHMLSQFLGIATVCQEVV